MANQKQLDFENGLENELDYSSPLSNELDVEASTEVPVDTSMSAPEAFTRHFGYSASLGASDPLSAGICALMPRDEIESLMASSDPASRAKLQAAMKSIQPNLDVSKMEQTSFKTPSRRDEYYASKKGLQEGREKASCDQMLASTLGVIGGGVASPIPGAIVGKLGKAGQMAETVLPNMKGYKLIGRLKDARDAALAAKQIEKAEKYQTMLGHVSRIKAAKEGAKAGAAFALTGGDAKLLEGDVKGTAKEAASGAALGAFVGGAIDSALTGLGYRYEKHPTVFKNLVVEPIKEAFKGFRLNESAARERATRDIKERVTDFMEMKQKVGKEFDVIEKFAQEKGIPLDNESSLSAIEDAVEKIPLKATRDRIMSALSPLKPYFKRLFKKAPKVEPEPRELARMREDISNRALKAKTEQERIDILSEGKAAERAIKEGRETLGSDEYTVQADEYLPDARPHTKVRVRQDRVEKDILDEDGVVVGSETDEIITPRATTEFVPTDLEHVIDPITGRPVARYPDAGKGVPRQFHGTTPKSEVLEETLDPSKMSYMESKNVENELSRALFPGGDKLSDLDGSVLIPAIKARKEMAGKRIASLGETAGPGALKTNEKYTAAMRTKDLIGIQDAPTDSHITEAAQKIYAKITNPNVADYNAFAKELGEQLSIVDPGLSKKVMATLEQARTDFMTHKGGTTGRTGLSMKSIGFIEGFVRWASNSLGRIAAAPVQAGKSIFQVGAKAGKQALDHSSLSVIKAPVAKIDQMIQKLSGNPKAKEAMNALLKAKESPDQTRAAIMFGLYQQPWFREAIKEEEEGQNE